MQLFFFFFLISLAYEKLTKGSSRAGCAPTAYLSCHEDIQGGALSMLPDSRESVMILEWKQILPLEGHSVPDQWTRSLRRGIPAWFSHWSIFTAIPSELLILWRGIIFQYAKLLLAEEPVHPTGNRLKQSPPCRQASFPRPHRLITLLTLTSWKRHHRMQNNAEMLSRPAPEGLEHMHN